MAKWIAEFDLEDGDTMPEHMELEYKGAKIDFHCRPMGTSAPPSAQPERKKGKWLEWMKWTARSGFTFGSICSECGYITSEVPDRGAKNCPGCGAYMRDGKE